MKRMSLQKFSAILRAVERSEKLGEPWAYWNEDLMPLGYKLVRNAEGRICIANIKPQEATDADLRADEQEGDNA